MKTCSKCGESKPLEAYAPDKRNTDGCNTHCRVCHKEYYKANREKIKEKSRIWVLNNPEKRAVISARHSKNNRPSKNRDVQKYRALKASNGSSLVTSTETSIIVAQPCTACGKVGPSEVDHIIPIARGGSHTIGNLMPLCRSCNASKCDMLYIEWKYSSRAQAQKAFASP